MAKKQTYGNDSITSLKGADRVRLRPAVIFGSDGIDGCQHSIFEILSNSIDEARQGYGKERKRWVTQLTFQRKNHLLGRFKTKREAIAARKAGEKQYYGKYRKK